jgi:hypothetical protein
MKNVNGALLKRKSESENSDSPPKRIRELEDGQSTSKKLRRDHDSDTFSFSGSTTNVSFLKS